MKKLKFAPVAVALSLQVLAGNVVAQETAPVAPQTPTTETAPTTPQTPPVAPPTVAPPTIALPTTPTVTAPTTPQSDTDVVAATTAYNAGLAALKREAIDEAGEQFARVVTLNAKDTFAQMFLGYVRFKQNRLDEALAALEAARAGEAQLPPKLRSSLYNNLGLTYWNRLQPEPAISAYQKALTLDAESNDARFNLASALSSQKRYKEALPLFTALLLKTPDDAALHDSLGLAYERTGQWPKALQAYGKAIALEPKNAAYQLSMAYALEKSGRANDGVKYLRQAVTLDPQNSDALLHLGDVFIARARWAEAQEVLSRYVALKPDDFVGWYNLGVSYDYHAKFDSALQAYAQAAKISPNDASVKNNVGRILYKRGRLDEAVVALRDALQSDSNNLDARYNLGLVLAAQNKLDDANTEWKTVITATNAQMLNTADANKKKSLQNLLVVARGAVAENYLKNNRFADAAQELGQLLKLAPNNIPALTNRGFALYHIKNYDEAEKTYREVLKRDAKNAFAHNNLGAVLEAKNQRAGALEAYRKAVEIKPDYTEAKSNVERLTQAAAVG